MWIRLTCAVIPYPEDTVPKHINDNGKDRYRDKNKVALPGLDVKTGIMRSDDYGSHYHEGYVC